MFLKKTKKIISSLVSFAILATTTFAPFTQANAAAGMFAYTPQTVCSNVDCNFQTQVPKDNWTAVGPANEDSRGGEGLASSDALIDGESWMSLGQDAAGMLGLNSSELVLKSWQNMLESPPWLVARYLRDKAELSITAMKTIKLPNGKVQAYYSEYTPSHGSHHVARRAFLSQAELRNPSAKGINPFLQFDSGDKSDPVFYNVSLDASRVILSEAMAHYGSPYAMIIDADLRLHQESRTSKSWGGLRKKVTTYTYGYAKPVFHLAMPLAVAPTKLTDQQTTLSMYCPRGDGACTNSEQVAVAPIFLHKVQGGNMDTTEELIYSHVESKSGWTVLAFILVGFLTFGAAAAAGYMVLNAAVNGGSLTTPQSFFFNDKNLNPGSIQSGSTAGTNCNNQHCSALYSNARAKHTQSIDPARDISGVGSYSSGNLKGARVSIKGAQCDPTKSGRACESEGSDPGFIPRNDTYGGKAYNSEHFNKRRQACESTGNGSSQAELYKCMSRGVVIQ